MKKTIIAFVFLLLPTAAFAQSVSVLPTSGDNSTSMTVTSDADQSSPDGYSVYVYGPDPTQVPFYYGAPATDSNFQNFTLSGNGWDGQGAGTYTFLEVQTYDVSDATPANCVSLDLADCISYAQTDTASGVYVEATFDWSGGGGGGGGESGTTTPWTAPNENEFLFLAGVATFIGSYFFWERLTAPL